MRLMVVLAEVKKRWRLQNQDGLKVEFAAHDMPDTSIDFGSGIDGGAHDAARRAVVDARDEMGRVRRILTRFDDDENNTWLDPDRSGPPTSALNQLYDDARDLVTDAEQALEAARAEHAARTFCAATGPD